MEIWHHFGFGEIDHVEPILVNLNIKYKKSPLPGNHFVISFDLKESDLRWPKIEELSKSKNTVNLIDTIFTKTEILSKDWVRLEPIFRQGYPQPEDGWESLTYEGGCPKCGAGYKQINPFRLAKEPKMGKEDFVSLFWTYALFCTSNVQTVLQKEAIRGYEVWPAQINSSGQPSGIVSQIISHSVTEPGLSDQDKPNPKVCPKCGITKYEYHNRGYMHYRRDSLKPDVDIQQTSEWFGSGGMGFREFLISRRLAKLIIESGWRGVSLKPIELI